MANPKARGKPEKQRPLAEVRDYYGLFMALRARAEQVGASRLALDDLAGLQPGYSGKLLGPGQVKKLGPLSLGALLQALGLKLIVMEDSQAVEQFTQRVIGSKQRDYSARSTRRVSGGRIRAAKAC